MLSPPRAAIALAIVFFALSCLHVYWALRNDSGTGRAIPTTASGEALFRPGRALTMVVAAALAAAALVVLAVAHVVTLPGPEALYRAGAWVLGLVLLARTVGDFRYVGIFKRVRDSRFARLETRIYSPLCALLSAGVFYVAMA